MKTGQRRITVAAAILPGLIAIAFSPAIIEHRNELVALVPAALRGVGLLASVVVGLAAAAAVSAATWVVFRGKGTE